MSGRRDLPKLHAVIVSNQGRREKGAYTAMEFRRNRQLADDSFDRAAHNLSACGRRIRKAVVR
jgi:hypothetical protein